MKRGILIIALFLLITHLPCLGQELSLGKDCGHEEVSQYISKYLPDKIRCQKKFRPLKL
jgi:hypothetical protein